ncbi:DUF2480 family protein [Rhodohalobacter mucosus]|uniref:DUF2480 family protein n=1 Tax=Rhodohalobacter mucosus TaxID=2079485 RepID=A0A316TX08_9BACT|nr:DUF2480 family protein [Rhodohalobacter mucosus]PWN07132.1 hypothetical protein DDZ15_07665 [Rhodohalobacter mucosus]
MSEIVNKVQQSRLETVDLEKFASDISVKELDLKDFLFHGMILKEKEYRENISNHDWEQYKDSYVAVFCSTDAIIPKWAYMLVVSSLQNLAADVLFGTRDDVTETVLKERLDRFDWSQYSDKFVLLKGCSKINVPPSIYMKATKQLLPHVSKLMYGEACSNVPVYRKPRSPKGS